MKLGAFDIGQYFLHDNKQTELATWRALRFYIIYTGWAKLSDTTLHFCL